MWRPTRQCATAHAWWSLHPTAHVRSTRQCPSLCPRIAALTFWTGSFQHAMRPWLSQVVVDILLHRKRGTDRSSVDEVRRSCIGPLAPAHEVRPGAGARPEPSPRPPRGAPLRSDPVCRPWWRAAGRPPSAPALRVFRAGFASGAPSPRPRRAARVRVRQPGPKGRAGEREHVACIQVVGAKGSGRRGRGLEPSVSAVTRRSHRVGPDPGQRRPGHAAP